MKCWGVFFCMALTMSSAIPLAAQTTPWVSAHYAGWTQKPEYPLHLPENEIDYDAVTHIMHFAAWPNYDGTLDLSSACDGPPCVGGQHSVDIINAAHLAGKQVLIVISGPADRFIAAVDQHLSTFVSNIVTFVNNYGYDGVDINWEGTQNEQLYRNLINALYPALEGKLLTASTGWYGDQITLMFRDLQNQFDQINLMTYDMSGPFPEWVSWHNSGLHDDGIHFPCTGCGVVPSADSVALRFINRGVSSQKLGIATDFYGYKWVGGMRKHPNPANWCPVEDGIHDENLAWWRDYGWGTTTSAVSAGQDQWVSLSDITKIYGCPSPDPPVTVTIIQGRNVYFNDGNPGNREWVEVKEVDIVLNRIRADFDFAHVSGTPIGVEMNPVIVGDPFSWKSGFFNDRAYRYIMDEDYPLAQYDLSDIAKVPYLKYNIGGYNDDFFVSYDNQGSIEEKWNYIDEKNLSGHMIWELGGGYRRNLVDGLPDSLLQAVKIPLITKFAAQNKSATKSATAFNSARHLAKSGNYLHEVFTSGGEIFYRRSEDGGSTWNQPVLLSKSLKKNSASSIAIGENGSIQIVWQRRDPLSSQALYQVWHRRSLNFGLAWDDTIKVAGSTVSTFQTDGATPVISYATSLSKLVVVFCSQGGLRYRYSNDDGKTWQTPLQDVITSSAHVQYPSLTGGSSYFSLVSTTVTARTPARLMERSGVLK